MRTEISVLTTLLGALTISAMLGFAQTRKQSKSSDSLSVPVTAADDMRLEGERRFHSNCGRCHIAPHKFPPRIMASVIRHMRVRATITEEDMRLILFYMTE